MPAHPSFSTANLESICQVLADSNAGLTGTEIGRLLQQLGIADPHPGPNGSVFHPPLISVRPTTGVAIR